MSLTLTILGCGSSGGVPRVGPHWGACDPANPKNHRRRASALITRRSAEGATQVLIDSSPDMRAQLLDAGVGWLDGVLYTHDHADHVHGIDDLRMIAFNGKRRVDAYFTAETRAVLEQRFDYCFRAPPGSAYPPILNAHQLRPMQTVSISGKGGSIELLPFEQQHGDIVSLGFRIGGVAYSSDISGVLESAREALQGLDAWILDALRYIPHPSHFHLKRALEWIDRLKPKCAILTHMTTDLDYDALVRELPAGVEPAYDGMVIEFD